MKSSTSQALAGALAVGLAASAAARPPDDGASVLSFRPLASNHVDGVAEIVQATPRRLHPGVYGQRIAGSRLR